jgi:hypothetical protein
MYLNTISGFFKIIIIKICTLYLRHDSYKLLYLTNITVPSGFISKLSLRTILFRTLSVIKLLSFAFKYNISTNSLIKVNVTLIIVHYQCAIFL